MLRGVALAALLSLAAAAPAEGAAMVFIKRGDVWMSRPDGSRALAITKDGRPGSRSYFSPSISDDGTIVALKGIHLHSFRPSGRRIRPPREWAILGQNLSTEPIDIDLSPNGRVVATDNALYNTFYDPRTRRRRPTMVARYVDFVDFRTNRSRGETDSFYDYGSPAWTDSRNVLTTSYGLFNAQVLKNRVGSQTRGSDFYRDPGRDPLTGSNSYILADAELTRAGDRWAVMRRPLQGADAGDPSVGTIQIYRTANPSTASTPICRIGPGRRIGQAPDPSWTPDGRRLLWWESGRGIFSTRVTSAPGCGLRPRRVVRGGLTPDLSRANVPRRRKG